MTPCYSFVYLANLHQAVQRRRRSLQNTNIIELSKGKRKKSTKTRKSSSEGRKLWMGSRQCTSTRLTNNGTQAAELAYAFFSSLRILKMLFEKAVLERLKAAQVGLRVIWNNDQRTCPVFSSSGSPKLSPLH